MIPAPLIDRLTAFLVWLAERIAEIRERNALRDQAALEQAALEQAAHEQAGDDQAGRDRDPAMAALSAADPAPAAPDARGGSRRLLPTARLRQPPVTLVPDGRADAATAAAGYAGARTQHVSMPDITALWCLARHRWAGQAAAPARLRGAETVGWNANSGPARCGRRTS
ncbi:MAG: hypothetical protein HIU82_04960 [Proteobacteria bacterium]|nr:hypothetical protein [Pseudomonadota bacterium]